jgi:hypothetical protein
MSRNGRMASDLSRAGPVERDIEQVVIFFFFIYVHHRSLIYDSFRLDCVNFTFIESLMDSISGIINTCQPNLFNWD